MSVRGAFVYLALMVLLCGCTAPAPRTEGIPDLGRLRVVTRAGDVPGYDRSCQKGRHACSFGPAWTDDNGTTWGHDGCDTRAQVLARDLEQVVFKPGTHRCVVVSGQLRDPYTDRTVDYRRGANPQPVQVDHVFGLGSVWDRGAASWPQSLRTDLANDPRNLLATTAAVNESKSDKTPQDWRPPARSGWCTYARHFYDVAVAYDLAVTRGDVRALKTMLQTC